MNPIVIAPATVAPITVRPADGVPVKVTPSAVPAIQIGGVAGIPGASGISVLDVEAAQDADGTVTLRFAMSDGAVHEVEFRTGGVLPPGDLVLAGAARGVGLAEAVLRLDRALAGSATATGTASATLAAWLDLAAAAATSGTATGHLAAVLDLAGSARSVAVGGGVLRLALELAGAVTARAEAAGALRLGSDLTLQATAFCRATADSVMLLDIAFAGAVAGRGLATATLLAALDVAGSATGRGLASAAILVSRSLSASVSGVALASGTIELAAAAGYDPDAQSYFNAQTTAPSTAERDRVDVLVKGLKWDGLWTKIHRLALHAAETQQAALINLKNPAQVGQAVNLPTFTPDRGFTFNGTDSYVDGGYAPSQNSNWPSNAHMGVWARTVGVSGTGVFCGVWNQTIRRLQIRRAAGTSPWLASMSANNEVAGTTASDAATGLLLGTRTADGSIIYRNGAQEGAGTQTPNTPNDGNIFVGARNNAGSPTNFLGFNSAIFCAGEALTPTDVANLRARLFSYLNSKGAA